MVEEKMDLRQYLSLISLDSLLAIARSLGQHSEGKTKAELVNLIDRRLSDPAFLKRLLSRLTDTERAFYTFAVFSGEEGIHSQRTGGIGEKTIESANSLVGKGLVAVRYSYHRGFCYVVPDDLRTLSLRILAPQILAAVETRLPHGLQLQECGLMILRDIFTLLSYITQQEVYLTKKGEINKRIWSSIAKRFEMREDTSESVYPSRSYFALRYCHAKGLIKYTDNGRVRTTSRLNKWLEMSNFERLNDLFSYVKNVFSPARYAFEEGISALFKEASTTELFDIASFMRVSFRHCYSLGKEKQAPPYYAEALCRFLRFLFWLGILRFGVDKQGTPVAIGISKLGQSLLKGTKGASAFSSSNELFVQPNFEVLAPREFDFKLRFKLEQFADLSKIDQMMIYKIQRDSVYRALDNGVEKKAIVSFLQGHSKTGLPQNVAYSIDEWARNYGRVFFQDAFLLRTTDQGIASEIKANPMLRRFIKGEVCPTALIVQRESYPRLLKKLKKMGYMPRRLKVEEDQNASSASEPRIEPVSDFWNLPGENIRYDNLIEPADLLMSEQPREKSPVAKHQGKPIPPHFGICCPEGEKSFDQSESGGE